MKNGFCYIISLKRGYKNDQGELSSLNYRKSYRNV